MKQYVIDAFAEKLFEGNPAAVLILDAFPEDGLMQDITRENALSETAFVVPAPDGYNLRWFTPGGEIDLCGHATLAAGSVLLNQNPGLESVTFHTLSGDLTVKKNGDLFEMDFPAYDLVEVDVTARMEEALGLRPVSAWMGRDLVCVLDNEDTVKNAKPDLEKVKGLDGLLFHITARGTEHDCVSRSFAPKCNVAEDPVCGSGHCHLVPYWAKVLGKADIVARQASRRGGTLYCRMEKDRVKLAGKARVWSVADINI